MKKTSSLAYGKGLKNKEKAKAIIELSKAKEYKSITILQWLKVAKLNKSSFYEWKEKLYKQIKSKEIYIIEKIKDIVKESKGRYGYRRVSKVLRLEYGLIVNHKKVLRIMKENELLCIKFKNRVRKYNSYKGTVGKIANNIVNRNFKADKPNKLWLTDITEFKIRNSEKKIYLSPILDTFNGEIISYSIGFSPTVTLTNKSLEKALKRIKNKEDLTIHTDQGFHYQHSSFVRTLENNNIKQSMSRKGNCLDNAPMENFFGILKQEMFYGENYSSYEKLIEDIKEYIKWYNTKRIKENLKGMSPIDYRLHSFE